MSERALLIVVLAAGKGTRMKSDLPKVLHKVAGRSMLAHVLDLAKSVGGAKVATVIGPGMDLVRAEAAREVPGGDVFVQEHQRGTADAVLAARKALGEHSGDVMVLYADTPLITPDTLLRMRSCLDDGASVAVLGFEAEDPAATADFCAMRAVASSAIREHKDATAAEREVRFCNSGVLGFRVADLAGSA